MIYNYIDANSFIGTTYSGLTVSSTGVEVTGLSSSVSFSTITRDTLASFNGDRTPIVFIDTQVSTNYTFPTDPPTGTTIMIRRTSDGSIGSSTISRGGTNVIRLRSSSINSTSFNLTVSTFRCFFFSNNTWWEF